MPVPKTKTASEVITSPAEEPARFFEIDPDTDVHIRCPECYRVLWLTSDEAPTLSDVINAANAHECSEGADDA
jgi:hypothetical protein